MALIELRGVSKVYEQSEGAVHALKDVNLEIERSDVYGIIGMSGAGKSTLVRCLNFLERPTEGEILIDGKNLATLSEKELRKQRSETGMIFQHFNLLMQKNVISNVCFPLRLLKVNKKEAEKRAMELLDLVGLSDKEKAYPAQLSGGQKQRVAIARALASSPKILLCDEATSALDPQTTESILQLLKQINKDLGITVVIITHQMSVVQEACNKVAIIENGQVAESGEVEKIFNAPKSKAGRRLIYGDESKVIREIENAPELHAKKKIRIVYSKNSAFEPVIADMILHFQTPVNILHAETRNVGGIAKGEMILGLPENRHIQVDMEYYLRERGLEIQEVEEDV